MPSQVSRSAGRTRRAGRQLLDGLAPLLDDSRTLSPREVYARELIETTLKLLRDDTETGELKLLNAAIRELRYALKVFAPYRRVRKIAAFGSARTDPASKVYRTAVEFSARIADAGYMVITGAGGGIMTACQEGAGRERSFGVNIRLPFEQEANPVIAGDQKLVTFRYFFTRKLMFVKEADAVVLFPGGFGTMDEAFETITLIQTGKSKPMPVVMLDEPRGRYWRSWQQYVEEHLLRLGLISAEDFSLFRRTTSIDEALAEILGFYKVYHSSRFVGDVFVLRLEKRLDPAFVRDLSAEFVGLVGPGGIEQRDALPEEREQEPHLDALPRLVFRRDTKRAGDLRRLIDRVNEAG
jgi:uncharacterized protein (TIGR00730 family)